MGGLMSKSQQQSSANAAAAASETPKEQDDQKKDVEVESSPNPQQTEDVKSEGAHHPEPEAATVEPSAGQFAVETTAASQPADEPVHQSGATEQEVVTPSDQSPEQQSEPEKVDTSPPETAEAASPQPAPVEAVGEVIVSEPETLQADLDKLTDDVAQLKIVPEVAHTEADHTEEITSPATTEVLPSVNDDQPLEQTSVGPVDNAGEQRMIENEAA